MTKRRSRLISSFGIAINRVNFRRKARRFVASFIPFVLAVSTLSAISVITAPSAQALTTGTGSGLFALIKNETLAYSTSPTYSTTPTWMKFSDRCGSTILTTVDFDWTSSMPAGAESCGGANRSNFTAMITGYLLAPATGNFTFKVRSDDGFIMKLNGASVISNWVDQGATAAPGFNATSSAVALTEGRIYPIQIFFHQTGGAAEAHLFWNYGSGDQIIPQSNLGLTASDLGTGCAVGESEFCPADNARQIKSLNGTNTNGQYWINVGGVSTNTYSLMDGNIDGGGWMLAMKGRTNSQSNSTTFLYDANYWTTANVLSTGAVGPGGYPLKTNQGQTCASGNGVTCVNGDDADSKHNTFNTTAATEALVVWPDVTGRNDGYRYTNASTYGFTWKESLTSSTGYSNSAAGGVTSSGPCPNTAVTLLDLFSNANRCKIRDANSSSPYDARGATVFSSQNQINYFGFNYYGSGTTPYKKVRFGFGWNENQPGDEGSNDVNGGIGMGGTIGGYAAGDYIGCCQTTTGINRQAGFEFYVRNSALGLTGPGAQTAVAGTGSTFSGVSAFGYSSGATLSRYLIKPIGTGVDMSAISINASTGAVTVASGVSAGTYNLAISLIDTYGQVASAKFTLTVADASLSALTISSGTLSPSFASSTTSYSATVATNVSAITVTPTAVKSNSTYKTNVNSAGLSSAVNSGTTSGSLSLNLGSNTIAIVVTDVNGSTSKTYTLTVTREVAACSSPATTSSSSYTYIAIKSIGVCGWTPPAGVTAIDLLVVAGGGGGASRHAGGGGAGGLINATSVSVNGSAFTITVGAGGAGGAAQSTGGSDASSGNLSSVSGGGITTRIATGGGGGGYGASAGSSGGSGGGGGSSGTGGAGTAGQGSNGSAGATSNPTYWVGGGGGGAGGAGATSQSTKAGSGGAGVEITWLPSAVGLTLGVGTNGSTGRAFAGGGGGGSDRDTIPGGDAGSGGGAAGSTGTAIANSGIANSGGGGGGSGISGVGTGSLKGGDGGSGVVVIRYVNLPSISLSTSTISSTVGTAVTSYTITQAGGPVASYSISPSLAVSGLSFSTSTGQISGSPTAAASSATYTITATNTSGTSTATFTLSAAFTTCSPTVISSGGFTTLTFLSGSACAWTVPTGVTSAEVLVVGGGGGGNRGVCSVNFGAGAGGGGVSLGTRSLTPGTSVTVTVGAGGAAATGDCNNTSGQDGGASSFGLVQVNGGIAPLYNSFTGGSSGNGNSGGSISASTNPCTSSVARCGAGGGGGASAAGSGLNGGAGVNTNISGTSVTYGGGGPGKNADTTGTAGDLRPSATRYSPVANTGGGGADWTAGAAGVVIVRYALSTPSAPTITAITAGNTTLSVAFNPPSTDGGAAITNYEYSTDGGSNWRSRDNSPSTTSPLVINTTSASSPVTLVNGTTYNVQIRAVNSVGNGPATSSTTGTPIAPTQTITYAAGTGGSGSAPTSPTTVSNGSTFTTPANTYTRTGYTFAGWNDGTATYAANARYPASGTVSGNVTLTATWTINSQTITYAAGTGGTGSAPTSPTTVSYGSTFTTPANTYSRTGYTFAGWFDGSATYAASATYPATGTVTANVTLTATWSANTLTITYDSQSGSAISNGSTTTGGSISASPGTPTRSGYTFNGWFAAATGGTAIVFPYTHGQTANFTLYAQWTALTCAQGGTCLVGQIGPAGGIVIYVGSSTINQVTGISTGGIYLEAAPTDFSATTYNWCDGPNNGNTTLIGANGTSLGTGASNTAIMVAKCSGGAGNVAANYSKNGYSDWFLPSAAELAYLSAQKTAIGLSNSSVYWGSNESDTWVAASLVTSNGGVGGQNKAQATPLWPIRAFSPGDPLPAPQLAITRASFGTQRRTAFTTQPQITIQDASSNTNASSSAVVTATISAGGTLVGTTTATASSGIATFTNLGVDGTIGATYTITYSSPGLTSTTATITLTKTTCDGASFACQVGDTGPGGGIVFYVAPGGGTFACGQTLTSLCKYLEAAPITGASAWTDNRYAWSGNINTAVGSTSTAIGTGYSNTLKMVRQSGAGTAGAGSAARNYRGGGLNDWYLPSKDELYQLYINRTVASASDGYWSSSEYNATGAWDQGFGNGSQGAADPGKQQTTPVRPIRAFGSSSIESAIIYVPAVAGVTAPVRGATPVTTVTAANGYTGTVSWSGSPSTFAGATTYTATITLTATSGFTLTGATANFFTVSGATSVTHSADSGTITAVFPATEAATQTITRTSTSPVSPVVAGTYTPTATASSGLTVTITIASGSSSICSISGGIVTFNAAGSCVIQYNQAGNASYSAAAQVTETLTIGKASQTITFGSLSNKTLGSGTYSISATSSSSLVVAFTSATASVCTVATTTITLVAAGTCTINANQAGDGNYLAANQVQQSFTIAAALSITTPSGAALQGTYNTAFTSLTISSSGGAGSKTFSATGTLPTGLNLSSAGVISGTPSIAGDFSLTVTVTDANSATATTSSFTISIAKGGSTVSITVLTYTFSGSPQGPDSVTKSGSTGSVTFTYAGRGATTYLSTSTKPTNVGTYTVTATVASDSNFASANASSDFEITNAGLVITPTISASSMAYGTSGASLPTIGFGKSPDVSLTTIPTCVLYLASDTGFVNTLTLGSTLAAGSYVVRCSGATATNYTITYGTSPSFTVTKLDITLTVGTPASTPYTGSSVSVTNSFTRTSGTLAGSDAISGMTYTYTSVGGYNSTTAPTAGGNYTITGSNATFSSGSASNYTITYVAGALTITAATQTVTWAPNTSLLTTDSPATPSTLATALGSATISYAVTSAGTTGCTVNSSTAVLTFTTAGNCQVTATAAATSNYATASTVVTFVISIPTYVITLAAGTNGSGSNQTLTKTSGVDLTLPNSATANGYFTRAGYSVTGWSTTNLGSQTHALGGSFTTDTAATLYPVWTLVSCSPTSSVSDGYTIYRFATVGTCTWTVPNSITNVDILAVAGGGGGGYSWGNTGGGGGGGGQVKTGQATLSSTLQVTVGVGGSAGTLSTDRGGSGGDTTVSTITSLGGTGGCGKATPSCSVASAATASAAANGGAADQAVTGFTWKRGRGGGGSSGVRGTETGGDGTASNYSGTSISYGIGGNGGSLQDAGANIVGATGTANTGNGGGGAATGTSSEGNSALGANGGAGGSGLVIIRSGNSLNISYDANGGSTPNGGSATTITGGTISSLATTSRTGYTFNGWFTSTSGGTQITTSAAHGRTANFILYAQWSANSNTVLFNTQGGPSVNSQSWATGSSLSLPVAPSREGYTFNGWYDAATGGTKVGTGVASANALHFDGLNDRITIPHSTAFNFTNSVTIEAWINTTSTSEQYITTKGENSFYLATNLASGKAGFYLNNVNTPSNGSWLNSSATVNDGKWHHIAGTYDGTTLRIYVDGVLSGSRAISSTILSGSSIVQIGSRDTSRYFSGKISEVRYWNVARSVSEIGASMNATLTGTETGLVSAFALNQGIAGVNNSGVTTATNIKSGASDGTLSGFALTGSTSNWVDSESNSYIPTNTAGFTLYAQWTVNTYTITYKAGTNGSGTDLTQSFTFGNTATIKDATAALTRTGYVIAGWSTSNGGSQTHALNASYSSAADLLLYPVWSVVSYTITFDANGATGGTTASVAYGTNALTSAPSLSRTDYSFAGWSETSSGSLITTWNVVGTKTLYAIWTPAFVVTFVSAGTAVSPLTYTGTALAKPADPSRTGYSFAGWKNPSNTTVTWSYTPTASITLTAAWTINTYIITITQTSNGSISPTSATVDYGTNQLFTFTPSTGYSVASITVDGVVLSSAALATAIASGYTFTNVTATHTITATYSLNSYIITITQTSNGSISPTSATVNYGLSQLFTFTPATGYSVASITVDGTALSSAALATAIASGYTFTNVTETHTITATYSLNSYTITFDANGATGGTTASIAYGSNALSSAPSLSRTDYSFAGWSETSSGSLITTWNVVGTKTLYAIWTPAFVVSFVSAGSAVDSLTFIGTALAKPTNPSRTGYSFTNWKDSSNNTISWPYTPTASITLTANWSINTFVITITQTSNGSIAPSSATVDYGSNQSFTFTPATGYSIASITVDGSALSSAELAAAITSGYTFTNVIAVHSITATFALTNFTITFDANGATGGTTASVAYGSNAVSSAPNLSRTDYSFAGWSETSSGAIITSWNVVGIKTLYAIWTPAFVVTFVSAGTAVAPVTYSTTALAKPTDPTRTGYGFTNWKDASNNVISWPFTPTASITLTAQWAINTYVITITQTANGVISPASATLDYGSNQLFTFTPANGFFVASISVDGSALSSAALATAVTSGYTFTNVTATHSITATYSAIVYRVTLESPRATVAQAIIDYTVGSEGIILPYRIKANYVFLGWYTQATGGTLIGIAGARYTPTTSVTLYSRWIQEVFYGIDPAKLSLAGEIRASTSQTRTLLVEAASSSVSVRVPAGALPEGTFVEVYSLSTDEYARNLVGLQADYIINLVVAWHTPDELVPVATTPVIMTVRNATIKKGADVYGVQGQVVKKLATATVDGEVVVLITEDPIITVTNPTETVTNPTPPATQPVATSGGGGGGGGPKLSAIYFQLVDPFDPTKIYTKPACVDIYSRTLIPQFMGTACSSNDGRINILVADAKISVRVYELGKGNIYREYVGVVENDVISIDDSKYFGSTTRWVVNVSPTQSITSPQGDIKNIEDAQTQADRIIADAKKQALQILETARNEIKTVTDSEATKILDAATAKAAKILDEANSQAEKLLAEVKAAAAASAAAAAAAAAAAKPTPTPTPTVTKPTVTPATPIKVEPKVIIISCKKGNLVKNISGISPKCPPGYAQIKAAAVNPTKPVSKTITITCVKGALSRKVTGTKPVCPTGFIKKS